MMSRLALYVLADKAVGIASFVLQSTIEKTPGV